MVSKVMIFSALQGVTFSTLSLATTDWSSYNMYNDLFVSIKSSFEIVNGVGCIWLCFGGLDELKVLATTVTGLPHEILPKQKRR